MLRKSGNLKQRAYIYSLKIIRFIDKLDKRDYSVQIISRQLLRSASSVGANVIEAQAGSTRKDFTNFFPARSKIRQRKRILARPAQRFP